jgi:hypothetical protein
VFGISNPSVKSMGKGQEEAAGKRENVDKA